MRVGIAQRRQERIGFVSGPVKLKSAIACKSAFLDAMREIGLKAHPAHCVEGDHKLEGGARALQTLSSLQEHPTALLCSNDMTAIGVMREAFQQRIKISDDLSIIGFDNIGMTEFVVPPLTTVEMSQAELSRLAFNALLAEINRGTPSPSGTEYVLKTRLLLRDSTTFPPGEISRDRSAVQKSKPRKGRRV